jgi:hypothetical protein
MVIYLSFIQKAEINSHSFPPTLSFAINSLSIIIILFQAQILLSFLRAKWPIDQIWHGHKNVASL